MKFYLDNVNLGSSSGPNSFARKLKDSLIDMSHSVSDVDPEVQIAFILATRKLAPMIQRLDGIYFNSEQDWKNLNAPIKATYDISDAVVFQSHFNRSLTEKYFGKKELFEVIPNGTDLHAISQIPELSHPVIDKYEKVWCCAASWRPHKRLSENIRYFLEFSDIDTCLVVAGNNPDHVIEHERVFYSGNLSWEQLIGLYKRSEVFIHLALMDHCPNVVVDARASGCKIVCSDSGGTKEIAGSDAVVVKDMDWDYAPFALYKPPSLDFSQILKSGIDSNLDVKYSAEQYIRIAESLIR